MVAIGVGAVAIIATGGAAAPAAFAGAASGLGVGTGVASAGGTLASAVAGGAVTGGVMGAGTAVGAATVAGTTATAAATATAGAAGGVAGSFASGGMFCALTGPVGWAVLGASETNEEISYDCWKQVVRDTSPEPSRGRLVRDVAGSPFIKEVLLLPDGRTKTPQLHLMNVWNECFRLEFGFLPSGELVAHAVRVD